MSHAQDRSKEPHGAVRLPRSRQPAQHASVGGDPNFFPGLEFDLRSLWKHIFEGLELHEAGVLDEGHQVLAVAPGSPGDVAGVRPGHRLLSVDGHPVDAPGRTDGGPISERFAMEFFNALAEVTQKPEQTARCVFRDPSGALVTADLKIRPIFKGVAFAQELIEPGAMTQGLCSRGRPITASAAAITGPPAGRTS